MVVPIRGERAGRPGGLVRALQPRHQHHAQIGANVNKEALQSLEWQVLAIAPWPDPYVPSLALALTPTRTLSVSAAVTVTPPRTRAAALGAKALFTARYEESLNTFTHCLAVTEKTRSSRDIPCAARSCTTSPRACTTWASWRHGLLALTRADPNLNANPDPNPNPNPNPDANPNPNPEQAYYEQAIQAFEKARRPSSSTCVQQHQPG